MNYGIQRAGTAVLKLEHASDNLEGLLWHRLLLPTLIQCVGDGAENLYFNKFPDHADAAGLWTHVQNY